MMYRRSAAIVVAIAMLFPACKTHAGDARRATDLAQEILILDGHIDVPYRLRSRMEDVTERTEYGDFDYPRAVAGGLDAPFMSIYVPASAEENGTARVVADELIDLVEDIAARAPDKFQMASSVADVRAAFAEGRIALLMGMENGGPIEGDLANLEHFQRRGIRYITLCHSRDNHICDSSYDDRRTHGGLTAFGRELVPAMNRLGVLIDVSHVSDQSFWQVMNLTEAPVIASHSSLRHFTPGFERNMSDDMLRRLAENGGVIQINFGSWFLSRDYMQAGQARDQRFEEHAAAQGLERGTTDWRDMRRAFMENNPLPTVDVSIVADHIDRAVELVGIDYVGFGSDFDGVGDSLPEGLKDVSEFPNLIAVLSSRGYSEKDIAKIASGNVLRVMAEAERIAARARGPGGIPLASAHAR